MPKPWPALTTVTHLEMFDPAELKAKPCPDARACIQAVETPSPEVNRFFYFSVGEEWGWYERRVWSDEQWVRYVNRPELETWLVTWAGEAVGYCELERQAGHTVEIAYFGLLSAHTQKKLGGWFLAEMVRQAWAGGTKRVWVHTCDLDHPAALANYLARGFKAFKTTQEPGPSNVV